MNLGLALSSIRLRGTVERWLEPYFVIYATADAEAGGGDPLVFRTMPLLGVVRGKLEEFGDPGLLLLPPVPVGRLVAWRVELWESDQDSRDLGAKLQGTDETLRLGVQLVAAVGVASPPAAVATAIASLARAIAVRLRANGDDLLHTWEGSMFASQLAQIAGPVLQEAAGVTATFRVLLTEGEGPVEMEASDEEP